MGYPAQRLWPAVIDRVASRLGLLSMQARARGPFGFQPDNNATRVAEYPWAFHAVPVSAGQVVVDVGGSLGGLQFVLAKQGAKVTNVDPSDQASMGWMVDQRTIAQLNKAFGTDVELRRQFLQDAGLEAESVDTIYCISTIEHIPSSEIPSLVQEMRRLLKPGGSVVLTIDLFYDLAPFTGQDSNLHGTNIDVRWLVEQSGLRLAQGDAAELNGYPEFDPSSVLGRAMEFQQGHIALNAAQTLVLQKD